MSYNYTPLTESHDPRFKRKKNDWDYFIDPDQYRRVLKEIRERPANVSLGDRDYILFVIMGNLGLRIGEAALLRVQDFNHLHRDPPVAVVPALKKREKGTMAFKNIYLHSRIVREIQLYLQTIPSSGTAFLFPGSSTEFEQRYKISGHLCTRQISNIFQTYVRACGFSEVYTSHGLRHMYGSWIEERTSEPAFVRDQMGHASIMGMGISSVTNRYIHLNPNRIKELIKKVGYLL